MTLIEFEELFQECFAGIADNAKIQRIDSGEIVIYTNLMEAEDGELEEFEDSEDDDYEADDDDNQRVEEVEDDEE